ncbi:MAG: esterase-like activity of phytase family protein [bacterium]
MRTFVALLLCVPTLVSAQHSATDSLAAEAARGAWRYADRRVAAADGYRRIGPDFPGMGEHWLNTAMLISGKLDANRPTILIYAPIAGAPKLIGVGFVTTTRGDESADGVPGWPEAWHEHSGLLADESGVAPGASARGGTHVWVLHAWTTLANPDGKFSPDNWALPFLRAGLDVPEHADADAARPLAMLHGGDVYLRDVLTDAGMRTPSRASAVDSVLATTRTRVQSLIGARRVATALSYDELASLRGEWMAMATALRSVLGRDVERYLAPPHASPNEAHRHASPDSLAPWPGDGGSRTADDRAAFPGNLSGLAYEVVSADAKELLWAVRNGPSTLYRLVRRGDKWIPDAANGWSMGRALRYPSNAGDPDAEGVTITDGGSARGVYVAAERNNGAKTLSRNSVLRYDASHVVGSTLRATNEWNLTSDLPTVDANTGLEGIAWIADSVLVARALRDERTGRAYAPASYANHGTGLFFVGLETNGMIYVYALDHATNGFTRITSMSSGMSSVMALEYDRDTGYLWATCDDSCGNRSAILGIDTVAGSKTVGRFVPTRRFARPPSLPNVNNEGFALATACMSGRKAVIWSDDGDTGGHAIRTGSLPCGSAKPY